MHRKISTLGTKSYFQNFLIINYDSSENPHGKTEDSIISQPAAWCNGRLRSWTDFLLEKGKLLTNAPGCLEHPWRGHPSNPGLWHTCSSSSSPFPLEPFAAISGALTTVTQWCCRSRACFPPGEPTDPAGECRRRAGMSALHSCQPPKEPHWSMENHRSQQNRITELEKQHKGAILSFPRVNLVVTKQAPELIWVTKLSQHTAGSTITYLASLTRLPPWRTRKPEGTSLSPSQPREDFHLMLNTHSLPSLHFFVAKRAA